MAASESTILRVIDIKHGTTVDGPGFRTSIYFAGCPHHCSGCHNPQTWNPEAGTDYSIDQLIDIVDEDKMPVTFSGGDPIFQIVPLSRLALRLREKGVPIWCYTGYIYESLVADSRYRRFLEMIDVLVDGPYIESLRDTTLLFRGSSNQRIIDVTNSLHAGSVVLWESDF